MNKSIIFLDIDGVLATPATQWCYFDPDCVRRLKQILVATDAYIVISSSWRIGRSVQELKELCERGAGHLMDDLPENIGFSPDRVIDKTSNTVKTSVDSEGGRGAEISLWLKCNQPRAYIVIDDESFDLQQHKDRLVKTEMTEGLQDEHVGQAIALLGLGVKDVKA